MKLTETVHIPAPIERVWAGLNDPAILRASIPGCEQLDKTSPTDFEATAAVKVGPVQARFKGRVTLSELDPPRSCRITGEGTGGAAGFAKGAALVKLSPRDGGTDLTYEVDANVGGKLAQIGQRLIDQTAKKMADDFFTRFKASVAGAPAQSMAAPAASVAAAASPLAAPSMFASPAFRHGLLAAISATILALYFWLIAANG